MADEIPIGVAIRSVMTTIYRVLMIMGKMPLAPLWRLRIGGAEEFPADIGQAVDQDIKDDTCQHDYSQQRRTVDGDFSVKGSEGRRFFF